MNTILVIDSAVTGGASVSKALVREAVAVLNGREPAHVVHRDLGRQPIPHLTEETVAGDRDGCLAAALRDQPAWSDFPLVLLVRPGPVGAVREAMNATLVERPVRLRSYRPLPAHL